MKTSSLLQLSVASFLVLFGTVSTFAWTPLPVKQDQRLFMPGTQQGAVVLEKAENNCLNCHAGYDLNAEPGRNWQGSMMAQAARDPLWLACLTVADQDSIWALGNPNAGDLCIRCHTPIGWLGGRSDPPNASALSASDGDFEGINCDACHRMLDPFNALHQPGLAPETNATAISEDAITTNVDNTILQTLLLFNSNAFYNASSRLPVYYGSGDITNYSESTSGQYFVDPSSTYKRGPYYDAEPKSHQPYYSRFHKSRGMCATCHDVSNPALANVLLGTGVPERQAAGSYFHVERTLSEFKLSAYGRGDGTNVNPRITAAFPNVTTAATCQDCHMHMVTGKACNKNVQVRTNGIALHDLTGGNFWMSSILASADLSGPVYNAYNYNILSGTKYSGAQIDVAGLQGLGPQLTNGAQRALAQLHMAATLEVISNTASETVLRIVNNTGHKLISGFPEGRRMWLNVKFYDGTDTLITNSEINPYSPLVVATNAGNVEYVSGGDLAKTRDDLVYETSMMSSLTTEDHTFHFVLATDRYKDNRIPPKGFDIANAASRKAQPRWDEEDATNYFTAAEYAGGYDEVTFAKPGGTARWVASMYYQSTSKDYVEFLRNEINGTNGTLTGTGAGGDPAYIVQTDTFFATLKGWGNAIYDLWLANGGAAPIVMTSTNLLNPASSAPVVTSVTPACGPVAGGTAISISGSNFQSGATVNFATNVVVSGGTNITATTTANTAGPQNLTVANPDAQSGVLSNAFTFTEPPVFAGLQTATAGIESASLTWSAATSSNPVTYSVFQSLVGGAEDFMTPLLTTNALNVNVAPLDPGTTNWLTYYFVVRASDECGGTELNTVEMSVQPLLDASKDQDGDGMPNGYEQTYGLNPFDPADASLDPDNDNFTSLQESIAGTSPINGSDFPAIHSVTQESDGIHIWFQTVSGRQYQIQWRDSLTSGNWTNLSTTVSGDDTLRDVVDTPTGGTTARFYQLMITKP